MVDTLEVPAQTLWRWQQWWREVFAEGPWWRLERAQFIPPIAVKRLPGELLARLGGADLSQRLVRMLWLIAPPRRQVIAASPLTESKAPNRL